MKHCKVYVCGVSGYATENLDEQLQRCVKVIQNADANAVLCGIKDERDWLRVATTTRTPLNAMVLVEPPPEEFEVLENVSSDIACWDERILELQKAIYEKEYKKVGGEEENQ